MSQNRNKNNIRINLSISIRELEIVLAIVSIFRPARVYRWYTFRDLEQLYTILSVLHECMRQNFYTNLIVVFTVLQFYALQEMYIASCFLCFSFLLIHHDSVCFISVTVLFYCSVLSFFLTLNVYL